MTLPSTYPDVSCSLARALEVIGERWSLLIVRDAFYGVRRFSDFRAHLQAPRAVLADRLAALVEAGVLERVPGTGAHDEYALTAKGEQLWPSVRALVEWGDAHYAPDGPRRAFLHTACDAPVDGASVCTACGERIAPADLTVAPGPGLPPGEEDADAVSAALTQPHPMLAPLPTRRAKIRA